MSKLTRDRISDCEDLLDMLFYDKIFKLIVNESDPKEMQTIDEINRNNAFEILCNMIDSEKQRHKLAREDKLKQVFD